ncbi:unnamed protein product, partial [Mesorhabditis belari]|uniref:C-type lectin domain-containing protein n=1 Tax=Mesorhabditis belari TaxID=2138241 RepID=A0AAF3EUV5_9BILA
MLKVFQFTSILLFCQSLKGEPQCPNGSQYFEPLGYCLQAIKEAAPWGYAESYCQAFGGHLASIHNLMMNSVLNGVKDSAFNGSGCYVGGRKVNGSWTWSDGTKFSYQIWNPATTCPKGATYAAELGTWLTSAKSFYIGGRRNGGNYQWMDGSPFTYTKWSIGEPRFDCVLLVKETGNWITTNCSSSYQFICELPAIVNGGCSTTALTTTPTTQSPITYPPPPSLICPSDELLYTCQSDPQYFNGFAYWV